MKQFRSNRGTWASDEESIRLAVSSSVDRDALIESIVAGMRAKERSKGGRPTRYQAMSKKKRRAR